MQLSVSVVKIMVYRPNTTVHTLHTVPTVLFMGQNFHGFHKFGDISENKIVNFLQLQCPVGTFRNNIADFCENIL